MDTSALATVGAVAAITILATRHIKEIIMSEAQDVVDQITAQLDKVGGEITSKIADLEAQVAAGEAPDFTALKAAAQKLDDIVPDAPEPTE